MTDQQQMHIYKLILQFGRHAHEKYEAGTKEHKGFIGDLSAETLLNEALNEVIDQYVYLMTLKEKLGFE